LTEQRQANYSLSLTGSPTTTANITAKELTIGGSFTANNKVYDGNTTASFNANNLSLIGIVGTDDVSLTGEAIHFADPNVANNILVSITSASLSGTKAFNYSLSLTGLSLVGFTTHCKCKYLVRMMLRQRTHCCRNKSAQLQVHSRPMQILTKSIAGSFTAIQLQASTQKPELDWCGWY
jgi:hypothetical protein